MARPALGFSVTERDYRGGKRVHGPGGIDRVPAALTEGEFVVKRSSARKIGYDALHRMNRTGEIPMARMKLAKPKVSKNVGKAGRMRQRYQAGGPVERGLGRLRTRGEDIDALVGEMATGRPTVKPVVQQKPLPDVLPKEGLVPGMVESVKRKMGYAGGGKAKGLRAGYAGGGSAHPGFKAVAAKIGRNPKIRNPGAVLADATRGASAAAKKRNPRLLRVSGA